MSFAERNSRLSEARAEELARLAAPLVDANSSAKAQLLGIAKYLLGR
jgi:hypothetical protein